MTERKVSSAVMVVLFAQALFLAVACSSTDNEEPVAQVGEACTGTGTVCSDVAQDQLLRCDNGALVIAEECSASGKACENGACVADEAVDGDCAGKEGQSACAGSKLVVCTDSTWTESKDCAAEDKLCAEEEGGAVCKDKPVVDDAKPDDSGNDGIVSDDPQSEGEIPDDPNYEGTQPDNDSSSGCEWDDPNGDDDGDGIPNSVEGCGDNDLDGMPNWLDADSDGDGILDSTECPEQPCQNSDKDDTPDFLDKDSDNDGLADKEETTLGTNPYDKDTDGDGSDDLAEIVYNQNNPGGADPKDPDKKIPDGLFYVVLPYNSKEDVQRTLEFSTIIEAIDVAILVDRSGSMSDEISKVKSEIKPKIIDGIRNTLTISTAFALSYFTWTPNPPYKLLEYVTEDADKVAASVGNIGDANGDDEYLTPALFLLASGVEFHGTVGACLPPAFGGCNQTMIGDAIYDFPKIDCTGQLGNKGGACFRAKSMPIIIIITDEAVKECPKVATSSWDTCQWEIGDPVNIAEAVAAMNGIGAKLIGIDTGFDDNQKETNQLEEGFTLMAEQTGSLDKNGSPFYYHNENPDGSGMTDQIAQAVVSLTTYIDMDVTTGSMSDEQCDGISAAQFVKSSTTVKAEPPDGISNQTATTFESVKQGTIVWFDVRFYNDFCKNTTTNPMTYQALVTVLGNGSYLSSRLVTVIVPPSIQE